DTAVHAPPRELPGDRAHRRDTPCDTTLKHSLSGGHLDLATTDNALILRLMVPADDDVARLEDVIGRHLVRFGTRDELVVTWQRSDGTPGTEQRRSED
ncbi:DUF2218 domain-containing protein, partial [Actinoplanes sp. NPDC051343]|uniref:DUF2218 domain-containing protein n=1 Tax=Actinoplanes sp. NPDC051343 TaxID=3363906 RepID=UPI00378BCC3B